MTATRLATIGATGLVGSRAVDRLLAEANGPEVHALVRRPSGRAHPRFHEHVAPSAAWPGIVRALAPDAALSALGTTMRAAGSEAAFRAVDHDAVVAFARAARDAGARRMVTVSSVGADARARAFYLRVKGEMEEALAALGFDRVDALRPGLLLGPRGGERRPGERFGILLSPLVNPWLVGPLDRYRAIPADIVATAAAACLQQTAPGRFVHENAAVRALARRWTGDAGLG